MVKIRPQTYGFRASKSIVRRNMIASQSIFTEIYVFYHLTRRQRPELSGLSHDFQAQEGLFFATA
jgi:hypothetical protein